MIKLIISLLVLSVAVWFGIKYPDQLANYVWFPYHDKDIGVPLWAVVIISLAIFMVFYGLLRLVANTSHLAKSVGSWRKHRHINKCHRQTIRGLLQLAEGQWSSAESFLVKAVEYNQSPLINYLAAARAAQEQEAYDRRDKYLRLAHETTPGAEVAVGLTQAELQLAHEQLEHSLATLRHLYSLVPNHPYVLKLLKKVYIKLRDWQGLIELIPLLKKRKIISDEALYSLEKLAYRELLLNVHKAEEQDKVDKVWQTIPKNIRKDNDVLIPYINTLIRQRRDNEAEQLLREILKHKIDNALLDLYGVTQGENPEKQLETVEGWLKNHGNSPAILLCVGRLCIRNRLWGKARQYFEQCIELSGLAQACVELGQLLEQLGEVQLALQYYRRGLKANKEVT